MPTVSVRGRDLACDDGAILREVLQAVDLSPHNGRADTINCHGHGSCGTCAVAITGEVSDPPRRERVRLSIPPHDPDGGLRLACQTRVHGDIRVEKYPGFWGQHTDQDPAESATHERTLTEPGCREWATGMCYSGCCSQ